MIISANTQLGLRFKEQSVKKNFAELYMKLLKEYIDKSREQIKLKNDKIKAIETLRDTNFEGLTDDDVKEIDLAATFTLEDEENHIDFKHTTPEDDKIMDKAPGIKQILEDNDSKYFLITDSVYKAAELIKIKENFTGRTLKDVKLGKYTYLMGKHCMVRFYCGIGFIQGYYYNDLDNIAFAWHIILESGNYYFPERYGKQFSQIMQVLTFVELGDIEVLELEGGKNNGKKKDGSEGEKIHNSTNLKVFVVDNRWNTIIMRTDGFGVRGHFRLQPCGPGLINRDLIWIDSFEKKGYTRKAKSAIVN